jgi:hypothetical protein
MTKATDLIEDWIEMRGRLQRHLKMFEAGEMNLGDENLTTATVERLKRCIAELNALLKEYAPAARP